MNPAYVNIHTHRPTGRGIELRTAGIHPWEAGRIGPDEWDRLAAELDRGTRQAQIELFRAQLTLACERRLPVVLHCVRAFAETMRLLREQEPRAVIFHGFIGSPEQARQAWEKGYCLSFGERTFASPRTIGAIQNTPLSQLFLETDESETPIETIYARAAALLRVTTGELQRATTGNYERIFIHG